MRQHGATTAARFRFLFFVCSRSLAGGGGSFQSAEADQARGLGATASTLAMDLGPKRVSRMCMVSCMSSLYVGFVPLAMGVPRLTTFDRALVHMYLIRVFAHNTNHIHCKPYKMSSSQRDQ